MIMMKQPIYFNPFVIASVNRLSYITQSIRPLIKHLGVYVVTILMLVALQSPAANAQVDQSTLGDMQLRIIAIENTLRDLNSRVENDLFALRQNIASGSDAEDVLRRVDEKLNNINNLSNELISLNNKIQKTLQLAADNEFRILQLEAKIQSLLRLSAGLDSATITQDESSALSNSANASAAELSGSPSTPTDTGDRASAEASSTALGDSDNKEWVLPKSQLENGADSQTTGAANPPATTLEVTSPEPKLPSLLPAGTEIEQYEFAKNLMHQNQLGEAEAALIEFDARYPESDLSADVNFWIGRVQFVQGEHQRSLQTMLDFIQTWPDDPRRIEVLMWIAESFSVTRPKEDACDFFDKLLLAVEDPPQKLTTRLAKLRDKTGCEA